MPRPRPGETKSEYIKRAIPIMIREGYPPKEAAGRAYGFYRTYSKKRRKRAIPTK